MWTHTSKRHLGSCYICCHIRFATMTLHQAVPLLFDYLLGTPTVFLLKLVWACANIACWHVFIYESQIQRFLGWLHGTYALLDSYNTTSQLSFCIWGIHLEHKHKQLGRVLQAATLMCFPVADLCLRLGGYGFGRGKQSFLWAAVRFHQKVCLHTLQCQQACFPFPKGRRENLASAFFASTSIAQQASWTGRHLPCVGEGSDTDTDYFSLPKNKAPKSGDVETKEPKHICASRSIFLPARTSSWSSAPWICPCPLFLDPFCLPPTFIWSHLSLLQSLSLPPVHRACLWLRFGQRKKPGFYPVLVWPQIAGVYQVLSLSGLHVLQLHPSFISGRWRQCH